MPKKKIATNNPVEAEKNAEELAEALESESDEASAVIAENFDEEAEKGLIAEAAADADQVVPAEVAAIHTDNESAKAAAKTTKSKKAVAPVAKNKSSERSAKYKKASEMVEKGKLYSLEDALELVKKTSFSSFDGGVELHLRLNKKKAKGGTESSRGVFHLPHGSSKQKKIIILDEKKIEEIAKTKKIDFDVAIASPELMPKVAKIAKILGPKGKMPDPKSGTVTTDPKKAIEEINSGKIEYRIDSSNNVHQLIGRVSWDATKLNENAKAILNSVSRGRIAAVYVTASMGPSIAVDLSFLK